MAAATGSIDFTEWDRFSITPDGTILPVNDGQGHIKRFWVHDVDDPELVPAQPDGTIDVEGIDGDGNYVARDNLYAALLAAHADDLQITPTLDGDVINLVNDNDGESGNQPLAFEEG